MSLTRVLSRASRNVLVRCRNSSVLVSPTPPPSPSPPQHHCLPLLSNQYHSLCDSSTKASLLNGLLYSPAARQQCGFSSSASPQSNDKDTNAEPDGDSAQAEGTANGNDNSADVNQESGSSSETQSTSQSVKRRRRGSKRTAFSDSDSEGDFDDLSKDDLVKLVTEKEETLKTKEKEISAMKDKVLRTYAEMENVMNRTRREAENSKKFAIQGFAKGLLDVADNLGRASSVVKESYTNIDVSKDTAGAVPLLKTLLEGVEMTEKQLVEVFKKFGVEKYDPIDEQFDPNRHNAVFQVPDNSKDPGIVAVVLKSGYTLHDRVIRPAEVGVTRAVEAADQA
ncbi:hypothetical protein Dimus_012456 [Dionaea muscipula]